LLQQLRELGVRLTLDNFGSTSSALVLLRDYPFDTVKLDRSLLARFDADPDHADMMRTALQLVGNFGMVSIAQGVESHEQVAYLKTLDCACAQGRFLGVPLPLGRMLSADDLRAAQTFPRELIA
jgi:EAL domain-containing protein (putative c-di-GMP-specific phosphodiesterase class I)